MGQMYLLMARQVQSYHRHRYMGSNSSVSMELAQELMESMEYTIHQSGGIHAGFNAEEALRRGQGILEEKVRKAKSLLALVQATAPNWQTEGRWEAIGYLRNYLDGYDPLHLAHRGPDALYYPILISTPDGIQGIDKGLFYLNILWIENQIMAGRGCAGCILGSTAGVDGEPMRASADQRYGKGTAWGRSEFSDLYSGGTTVPGDRHADRCGRKAERCREAPVPHARSEGR